MIDKMDKFSDWLSREMGKRSWSYRETARRAGLTGTTIGDVVKGKTNPGLDFCLGIAKAFKTPPETVLRRAGLLPDQTLEEEEKKELLYYYDQLTPNDQSRALTIVRALAEQQMEYDETRRTPTKTKPSSATA